MTLDIPHNSVLIHIPNAALPVPEEAGQYGALAQRYPFTFGSHRHALWIIGRRLTADNFPAPYSPTEELMPGSVLIELNDEAGSEIIVRNAQAIHSLLAFALGKRLGFQGVPCSNCSHAAESHVSLDTAEAAAELCHPVIECARGDYSHLVSFLEGAAPAFVSDPVWCRRSLSLFSQNWLNAKQENSLLRQLSSAICAVDAIYNIIARKAGLTGQTVIGADDNQELKAEFTKAQPTTPETQFFHDCFKECPETLNLAQRCEAIYRYAGGELSTFELDVLKYLSERIRTGIPDTIMPENLTTQKAEKIVTRACLLPMLAALGYGGEFILSGEKCSVSQVWPQWKRLELSSLSGVAARLPGAER